MMEFNFKVTPNAEALFNNGEEFQKAAARCLGVNEDGAIEIVKDGTISAVTLNIRAIVITVVLIASILGYKHFKKKKLSPIMLIIISAVTGMVIYGL